MQYRHKGLDVFCVTLQDPSPPPALRRYQDPEAGWRSLGQSHSRLLDWVLSVMQGLHCLGDCLGDKGLNGLLDPTASA